MYIFIFPDAQRLICNSVGFFFACFFQVTLWRINVEVLKPRGLMMDRPLQICPSEKKKHPLEVELMVTSEKKVVVFWERKFLCGNWNCYVHIGLSPLPVIVEMKVYRDSLLKM